MLVTRRETGEIFMSDQSVVTMCQGWSIEIIFQLMG